jgi:ethanolamine utilization cobalamin adenosyltransferase
MKIDYKKPEYMTSLSGSLMVPKTHERIAFRGRIDSLEAEVIEAQILATQLGENEYCAYLTEILEFLQSLMAAEVKETPLSPPFLFGMNAE